MSDEGISILAARRAIAAIEDAIERIHEEGRQGDRAGWYALDRFAAIAKIAKAAADGREEAAYLEVPEAYKQRYIAELDAQIVRFDGRPALATPNDLLI